MKTYKNTINVFLSYAHADESLLQELETHLSSLKREGLITTWYDRQIAPGINRARAIDQQLERASIILLLVSADFLASDYCYQVEMKHAIALHQAGGARVIPIVVRPCDWSHAPFASFQCLPRDGKAITTWHNRDLAWDDVTRGIRQTIEGHLGYKPMPMTKSGGKEPPTAEEAPLPADVKVRSSTDKKAIHSRSKLLIPIILILFVFSSMLVGLWIVHTSWHSQTSGTSEGLIDIVWGDSQFVAVGLNGTILTSSNGGIWTVQNSGTAQDLFAIVWADSQFVVGGDNGTILTSLDGRTWTTQTSGTSNYLTSVAWSGSHIVALGKNDTTLISPNGYTWTAQSSDITIQPEKVIWAGSRFVAVGLSGLIMTSSTGGTWSTVQQSSDSNAIISENLSAIAWSGLRFVAVGDDGIIVTSPDGSNWTVEGTVTPHAFDDVIWAGSQFMAVGEDGTIFASPDGITWTTQRTLYSQDLSAVAWSGSQLVAVGGGGTILTPP